MKPLAPDAAARRHWTIAATGALSVHAAAAALVVGWNHGAAPPVPEPVVLVELPPEGAPAPVAAAAQPAAQPASATAAPQAITLPVDIPPARLPLPSSAVTLPPPAPAPVQQAAAAPAVAAAPATAAPSGSTSGTGSSAGTDPRARQQEANYFALVSAHLNRRKVYPPEARKARQQGVVTVRFTVDRAGGVTGASIKRGSGHDILDRATLDLLQRVAPLPRMPSSMQRESITLSLPIDYSLRTN